MMFPKKRVVLCILLLMLLPYGIVLAKGAPDKITINSPDLPGELEITDPEILESFAMDKFVDFSVPVQEPRGLEAGYEIARYYLIGGYGLKAIDRFVYYPNRRGDRGYVFYEGIIDKKFIVGGSPHDGKWFKATEDGERAILGILVDRGVHPTENAFWANPPSALTWLGYGGLVAVVSAIFFLLYRKLSLRRVSA